MNTLAIIEIGLLVILILICLGIWFYFRLQDKKIKKLIPVEILNQFQEAERRLKESNGNKEPYQILFELNRGATTGINKTSEGVSSEKSGIRNEGILAEPREQSNVQADTITESSGSERNLVDSNFAESSLARTIRKARAKKSITQTI